MELKPRKHGRNERYDSLRCVRADGSTTESVMPRQGTLPHDLIHAVVETVLRFTDGFIGLVAKGAEISPLAKGFDEYIDPVLQMQAAQAESVVEALQSQLWSGAFDLAAFRLGVETTCTMREVAMPDLDVCDAERDLYQRVKSLNATWQSVPWGHDWCLRFPLETSSSVST